MRNSEYKALMHVLNKLTDRRYLFSIYLNPDLTSYRCEMYFCDELMSIVEDIDDMTAFEVLIQLAANTFKVCNIEFYIYHNSLQSKTFYSFRRYSHEKWRRISNDLAHEILTTRSDCVRLYGEVDNYVSTVKYDSYHHISLSAPMA